MNKKFSMLSIATSSIMMAVAVVITPLSAYAASAWSTLTVNQHQDVHSTQPVQTNQSAQADSWVMVGDAVARAQASGQQQMFAKIGTQDQAIKTGASLQWACSTSNCTNASGDTLASVHQTQTGFSHVPMNLQQTAGTAEGVWFGGHQVTNNRATATQSSVGAVWDPTQTQSISGATHADGNINTSATPGSGFGGWLYHVGGQIEQAVTVTFHNIFTF